MPRKGGRQTAQEQRFIGAYVARGDATAAAKEAGYAHPRASASHALARPAIQAEIVKLQTERLFNDVLPLAVDVLVDLLKSPATPAGARVQAVKLALDRTLGSQDTASGKEPHEMTAAELADEIEKLKDRKAQLAKPVEIEGQARQIQPESGVFD